MSLKSWKSGPLFSVAQIYPVTDLDNTNPTVTNFDVRPYGPDARFMVVVTCTPNDSSADTGFAFKLQDTTTSGGSDVDMPSTHATTASSVGGLAAGSTAAQCVKLSFTPQPGRPWITLVGTKVDTDTDQLVGAHLIAYKAV